MKTRHGKFTFFDNDNFAGKVVIIKNNGIDVRFHGCNFTNATIVATGNVDFFIADTCNIKGLTIIFHKTVGFFIDGNKISLRNHITIAGKKLKHSKKMFCKRPVRPNQI